MQAAVCEGAKQCHRRGQQEPDSVSDDEATFCSGEDWISDWLFLKNRKQYSSRDSLPVFVVYSRFRYWRRELRSE
jgi:hypothetical protein